MYLGKFLLLLKYDHLSISLSLMFISKQDNFLDPHIVPVTDPVSLCEQFNCKHVCICLKRDKEAVASVAYIGSYYSCKTYLFLFFLLPAGCHFSSRESEKHKIKLVWPYQTS